MFNIDYTKLIRWFVPQFLRDAFTLVWLGVLCSPIVQLYNEFMQFRNDTLYTLQHDSRVFSIQAVLNDKFDPHNRTIYLTKGSNKDRVPIYVPAELKPVRLGTMALYQPSEYADTGVDFFVCVPNALTLTTQDLTELNILVNNYCLPDKQFNINRV